MTPRNNVSETTGLLQKAYDSTGSLPLASSYGEVRDSLEQQLQHTFSDESSEKSAFQIRRHAIGMFFGSCVLSVLVAVFLLWHPHHDHPNTNDRTNPLVPSFTNGDSSPFSLLDPVRDLGLPEIVRADDVSPDWNYFDASLKSPDDDRNALPTNSWYQNFLLVRDEPSNLHRAYPVPFLVDLVGVIPGLRAHVTHVESNSVVMQLSFNENFGLVLGATKSLYTLNIKNDELADGKGTKHWNTHKYKVKKATNLGITLEWVSLRIRCC